MDEFDRDEYFKEHPDEEEEFIEEMERLHNLSGPVDYPEYWVTQEWLEHA